MGFRGGSVGKETAYNEGDQRYALDSWVGKNPWRRAGNPLQYSCLENPMDREAWRATVHRVQRIGHDWATEHSTKHIPKQM